MAFLFRIWAKKSSGLFYIEDMLFFTTGYYVGNFFYKFAWGIFLIKSISVLIVLYLGTLLIHSFIYIGAYGMTFCLNNNYYYH